MRHDSLKERFLDEVVRRISSVIDPRMCSVNFNWPKGEREDVNTEYVSS